MLKIPKVQYKQSFRDGWLQDEEFKDWSRRACTNPQRAYCAYCKSTISAKIYDVLHQAGLKKHVGAMGGVTPKNRLPFLRQSTKTVNQEVQRIFSQMKIVKSKLRNAMSLKTLKAILYIRLV